MNRIKIAFSHLDLPTFAMTFSQEQWFHIRRPENTLAGYSSKLKGNWTIGLGQRVDSN
jgi:hypothetical protein